MQMELSGEPTTVYLCNSAGLLLRSSTTYIQASLSRLELKWQVKWSILDANITSGQRACTMLEPGFGRQCVNGSVVSPKRCIRPRHAGALSDTHEGIVSWDYWDLERVWVMALNQQSHSLNGLCAKPTRAHSLGCEVFRQEWDISLARSTSRAVPTRAHKYYGVGVSGVGSILAPQVSRGRAYPLFA